MQKADFSRVFNREMFTCISSNRVQPLRPQACIGQDTKKSNFLAVWTGGSFLITKWHTAILILWWFIFIHGKKRYFVQPRFKLHNTLFCIFFCSNPHPPHFHVLVLRLTRAIRHHEFGVYLVLDGFRLFASGCRCVWGGCRWLLNFLRWL